MEIDESILEKIKSYDIGDGLVLVCTNIQCTIRQHINESSILLITESTIFVLTQSQEKMRALCKIQWPFVTKIAMTSNSSFHINYQSGNFQAEHPNSSLIVSKIFNYLKDILFQDELPEIHIDNSFLVSTPPIQCPQLHRFLYFTTKLNMNPPQKLIKKYKEELKNNQMLDFFSYPSVSTYIDLLMDSITIGPSIESISLPSASTHLIWQNFEKIVKYNHKLNKVIFHETINHNFLKLAENIPHTIETITFCDSDFQEEHSQALYSFLRNANVHDLTFYNCCSFQFIRKLFESGDLNFVTTFSMVYIEDIDASLIYNHLRNLKKLKVSNTDTDISIFINSLPETTTIEKLSIKSAAAIQPINTDFTIPKTLHSITLEKIRWEQTTFFDCYFFFVQHVPTRDLCLNFSSANPPDKIWKNFFEMLPQFLTSKKFPKIQKLKFESNPIKLPFIQFLKALTHLQKLSLSKSLDQENMEAIGQFLSSCTTLKSLNLSGNQTGALGPSIVQLLNYIQKNKSIEKFDVSNNNFGDQGLHALQELLMSNKLINNICFSGNKIEMPDSLFSFFDQMEARNLPLKFDFPKDEIDYLKRKRKIRSAGIQRLKKSYERIQEIQNDDGKQDDVMSFDSSHQNDSLDDLVNGSEWKLPYPDMPEPDNTAAEQQFNGAYSLSVLVQKFYTSE